MESLLTGPLYRRRLFARGTRPLSAANDALSSGLPFFAGEAQKLLRRETSDGPTGDVGVVRVQPELDRQIYCALNVDVELLERHLQCLASGEVACQFVPARIHSCYEGPHVSGGSLLANRPDAEGGFVCRRFASGARLIETSHRSVEC
jgi:hypothetical protein